MILGSLLWFVSMSTANKEVVQGEMIDWIACILADVGGFVRRKWKG
jgi:hypothetical protein